MRLRSFGGYSLSPGDTPTLARRVDLSSHRTHHASDFSPPLSHAPDFTLPSGRFVRPPPATIVGTVGASPLTLVPCVSGTRRNALCRVLY